MDFGGNDELPNFLLDLTNMDKFDEVNTMVIARDAETNAEAAKRSIQHSMSEAHMPVPQKPFEYTQNSTMKTAFMIFPGPHQKNGTLENLCLSTVEKDPLLKCVDDYLECAKAEGEPLPRIHKHKLHCFLAGKKDCAGLPIGLASCENAWDFDHPTLEPFKRIIQAM